MPLREKRPTLVITFDATTQALAAEQLLQKAGMPGRLIPVPREITAGCGLAWKAEPAAREALTAALDGAGILWTAAQVITI